MRSPNDARLRLGIPTVDDRDVWAAVDDVTAASLVGQAEAYRQEPWPRLPLSEYARYWREGVRTGFEEPARILRQRTTAAVLATLLTAETVHLDEAADGLLFLCEQSSWCWAAHERFCEEWGTVVPDPSSPFLDLGAAETVSVLAWADAVLGPALDRRVPGLRRRMRLEADRRVVQPFLRRRDWHWLGLDGRLHNWNPWIHGHLLVTALFLVENPETRSRVVDLVVDGLDRYRASLPPDGGCDEGYAYWWNGPARLVEALELLDRLTDGRLGAVRIDPLGEAARFPVRMALGDGWYVNVGDGPARPPDDQPWHVLHRWGRGTGDDDVTAHAASHRDPTRPAVSVSAGLGRAVVGLTDPAWACAEAGSAPLPRNSWLPDVQVLVTREAAGDVRGLALAVKGGHNDENHNHNDVGSYVVAVGGAPVLIDLGQPTYTRLSFSDRRYEQWVTRSEWHNVPIVAGHAQPPGRAFRARDVAVRTGPALDEITLDLAAAYPAEAGCARWTRIARLDRIDRRVRVLDEWSARPDETEPMRLVHVLAGTPVARGPGSLTVRSLSRSLVTLSWDAALGPGDLEERAVDDPLLEQVWGPRVHRLVIAVPPRAGRFRLEVAAVEHEPDAEHGAEHAADRS